MAKGRRLSDEERARRRAEDRDRLEQAARALLSSDGWRDWVRVRSRNGLARYSFGNQLLIAMQAPGASFVAGFHAWHELGRTVRKGERGIRILAPMPIKDRDTADKPAGDKADEERVRTLFKSVAVFDVDQTQPLEGQEPVPLEPPREPITGDSHAPLLEPLTELAAELGYRVDMRELPGPGGGWCDAARKLIVVDAGLPANGRVRVLVHELAHALGIGYEGLGRERAEVMVDCVTYIVCGQLGLDTAGESIPYVAGWGEDGALDAIQAYAQQIDDVARRIHDSVGAAAAAMSESGQGGEQAAA
jgi:hypothetical protein